MKKLFLLDAMALIYRAYYALNKNPRINSKGLNTSAILGFANTLYDIIKNEKPTHIAVSFDSFAPTQRHIDFAEYKAHRESMPEDISASLPYIHRLIEAFNIPVVKLDGYEADDIIGTLAKTAEKNGFTTYMMTPDKDFGQLVSQNTFIYKPARMGLKPEIVGVKEICEKYGIQTPSQVIDILGLWGDASDNIPGVPGIGEVSATKLIKEFHSIENLYENIDSVQGKIKDKIIQFKEQAFMSKKLATIITDVPVTFDESQLLLKEPDTSKLKLLLDELEFRMFAKRVFTDLSLKLALPVSDDTQSIEKELGFDENPEEIQQIQKTLANINNTPHNYILLSNQEERSKLIDRIYSEKSFCFDVETTDLNVNSCELVGIAFALQPSEAFFIHLPDNYYEAHKILQEFKTVFESEEIEKIGQNIKFDIAVLRWYDIEVKGPLFDTMIAHYLIQPDSRHNMNYLAQNYLDYEPIYIEQLIGKKGKNQLSMRTVDVEIIKDYTCEDVDVTIKLKNIFTDLLKQNNIEKVFREIEIPLIPVLAYMEAEGVMVDKKSLADYSIQLKNEIEVLEKNIYADCGENFNISSPKQLGDILYNKLKIIDNPKKTAKKQLSTSEETLMKLINKHSIIQKILDYRSLTKLKSTYVDTLPLLQNPRTGRIHTSYNQAVAATGRLSSNNPNLQNIPIRSDKGKEIRKAFIPRNDNYILMSADYSQIELRLMAEMSKDPGMIEAFNLGEDIHAATASKVFNIPLADVNADMRRKAKTVNFGIIYGISAFGLSERINIPRKEAADIIEQYFLNFPFIKNYMSRTIDFARENGYVETLFGRRRYIRDINSSNNVVRGFAERNAINAPLQGTAADIIKIAMIDIHKEFINNNFKSKMILQVHDELVFDVFINELDAIKPIVENKMKNVVKLSIPITVDINTGKNWLDAH